MNTSGRRRRRSMPGAPLRSWTYECGLSVKLRPNTFGSPCLNNSERTLGGPFLPGTRRMESQP